jgi:hypothetical protein
MQLSMAKKSQCLENCTRKIWDILWYSQEVLTVATSWLVLRRVCDWLLLPDFFIFRMDHFFATVKTSGGDHTTRNDEMNQKKEERTL